MKQQPILTQNRLLIETIVSDIKTKGTKIVITHDHGQAKRLADEIVFSTKGHVLEQTLATQFFAEPETEAARAFMAGGLMI